MTREAFEWDPRDAERVISDDHQYVIHPWSVQSKVDPILVAGAAGSYFWDQKGKRYLDFGSQLVNQNIGHQHPRVVDAIRQQAAELCFISPAMANPARSELARLVAEVTPGDLQMSLFTSGGAVANENALRLARAYTGRHKVITRYHSYHGATYGMLSLTGEKRRWPVEPAMSGVVRMLDPYTYRCPCGHPDPCPVCTGRPHLQTLIEAEGPESIAAVMMEPITGTAGMIVPPTGYLESIREVCDEYGILLILDEVMVGFGRTGKWFACDHWDVVPDILTVAKGINSGYVPLGAMVVSRQLADWLSTNRYPGGLTYAGHPLACAAGVAAIHAMRDERMVENAAEVGSRLAQACEGFLKAHPVVGDVRGMGCFYALELVGDRKTKAPLTETSKGSMEAIKARALERGLYLNNAGTILRLMPPLNVRLEDVEVGLEIVDELLAFADGLLAS